jgi:hypothetical protein
MTTKSTGLEFKRFYLDDTYWPKGGSTYYDDVLLHVDGRDLQDTEDPRDIADNSVLEIRSGWVMGIPAVVAGGVVDMSLEDYFTHWQRQQTTATLVVECPRAALEQVIAALTAAGGTVTQGASQ